MEAPVDEPEPDPGTRRATVAERLRRAARWLRDLHRGFAYTGHLPRRRE